MKGWWMAMLVVLSGCGAASDPADLVLVGGRILTMDANRPAAEALAVRGDRIVAVGSEDEVRRLIGPSTRVMDLAGGVATPGLIEGHAHFLGVGWAEVQLDLSRAADWDEIVAQVGAAVRGTPPGQWIVGRGWHQERWTRPPDGAVEGLPTHRGLSAVSPDNPVLLEHATGHAAMVNGRALALLGITDATPDPPGGDIVRDAEGHATGILLDQAGDRAQAMAVGEPDAATVERLVALAGERCVSTGITSFQDAGSSFEVVDVLRRLAEEGELPLRLWVMLGEPNGVLAQRLPGFAVHRVGHDFLTVGGIKRYADGALGSHTAWMLAPYDDLPTSSGLPVDSPETLREAARLALESHLQLCVHAIGDRANREVLDIYQGALAGRPDGAGLRWRIEHAQHLAPEDVPRFARLGVIAAMQPVHCTSDGPWVEKRLGVRRAGEEGYLWRSLLDSGAVIASGTDAPVEAVDPIATFSAAVTRRMADGEAFHPEQAMTRTEALRSMTLDAAYAAFEEDIKGSLEVGKLADITVLSQDIMTVPDEQIPATRVQATIIGGEVRYQAGH